jgi:pilus assembly protein CpaB
MAVIFAGGLTYLVYRRLRRSVSQPKVIQVVAAKDNLPAGITLVPENLTVLDWPAEVPLGGSFSKTEDVVGRPLIFSLGAKEPVLARDLAAAGSGIGLSAKIPPGMRATAVRSNEIVGVAGFLFPGSHVDVLATYTPPGGSSSVTLTVLQNVEVLAAGQAIEPDPQGKPQMVNVVTLLLSPEDSQKLQLTSVLGSIQFILRNGVDQKKDEIRPTRLDQLVASSSQPPAPPATKPVKAAPKPAPPPPPKPPDVFVLEVIQGTQRSVQKF